MRSLRSFPLFVSTRLFLIGVGALGLPAAALLVPSDAAASVSIAVPFESLVKDSDAVAVVTPGEHQSVWEDGRIYTYTKVKVDQGVAGDLGAGADGWVRTMGGVIGKVGQLVDGEPVFTDAKPSLLFLRKFKDGGVFEVSARAQGQYPVTIDDTTKVKKIIRSGSVGMILPPKPKLDATKVGPASASTVQTQSIKATTETNVRLAQEVMHDRPLEQISREIAATWKRLHPAPATTK